MVVKINFFFPCDAQTSMRAMRARVTLLFDWVAFAVKICLAGSGTWKIARTLNLVVMFYIFFPLFSFLFSPFFIHLFFFFFKYLP